MCSNQRWEDKFGTKQRGLWTEEGTREAGPQRGEEECSVFSVRFPCAGEAVCGALGESSEAVI